MVEISHRKCAACKQQIEIQKSDVRSVIYYKSLYYHKQCFAELAEQKSQAKGIRGNAWKEALNNIDEIEIETKRVLESHWGDKEAKDKLNEYLLSQYDVTAVPDRFWQVAAELSNGFYKKKRCKKVSTQTLLDVWQWGQKNLDKIDVSNKAKHKGPKDGNERILYDLAVLVQHIPQFIAWQKKQKAAEIDREMNRKEDIKVDYNKIKSVSHNDGLDDISDLLDDLI